MALGVVFFWSVGALAQLNVDQFAFESGALYETDKIPLLISLVLGVGLGSVLAGIWSGGRIELGILPLGAFGVAICSMLLFTAAGDDYRSRIGRHDLADVGLLAAVLVGNQRRTVFGTAGSVHAAPQSAATTRLRPGGDELHGLLWASWSPLSPSGSCGGPPSPDRLDKIPRRARASRAN